jgi:XTP/dITP diphosphohydrolase
VKEIFFITSNEGKLVEIQQKVKQYDIKIIQKNLGYPEIQVDTLEEVAAYGVSFIQKNFSKPFIVEDAGIFINALNGFPGVFSKYVYYSIGLQGILTLMNNETNRNAVFQSVYAYAEPKSEPVFFKGECHGKITHEIKGTKGFGYDPIFIADDTSKTFAEMSIEEKNKFSHRGKALDKLIGFLSNI